MVDLGHLVRRPEAGDAPPASASAGTHPCPFTVRELKVMLSSAVYFDVPVAKQKLIFKGKQLQDIDTLSSIGLVHGSKVLFMGEK